MRLALLTLDSLVSGAAVRAFIAEHAKDIALVGVSNPYRANMGGPVGQIRRRIARSGLRILFYLFVNFSAPSLLMALGLWRIFPRRFMAPLSAVCRAGGITCATIEDAASAQFAQTLRDSGADLLITFHFDQILSEEVIAVCPLRGVNVHPSLLPLHRGPFPTFHALLEAPPRFGVTVHRLVSRIDAGPILAQEEVALPITVSATRAAFDLHKRGGVLLNRVLKKISDSGSAPEHRAYCPFPTAAEIAAARRRNIKMVQFSDLMLLLAPDDFA